MKFIEKLSNIWAANNSLLCIGIDPKIDRVPSHLTEEPAPFYTFAKEIIDRTHDLVCAYKFQIAGYSATGKEQELHQSIAYVKEKYPHIPVILDAKRGDIAISSGQYAVEAFERYQADAVTVNPYMGRDSAQPFLNYREKGIIFLCKTSNSGAEEFQDLDVNGSPLFERIAQQISSTWNTFENCLLVVGGTWPKQLTSLRQSMGDMPFLVPGLGHQGADLNELIAAGITSAGTGLIISTSRQIIYADPSSSFAESARVEAKKLNNLIRASRKSALSRYC